MLHRLEADSRVTGGAALPLRGDRDYARQRLTPQETHLLVLLIQGHQKKTAADVMGISVNTVSFHLKHVYDKLQVHSKTEAVAKALRERLV